MHYFSWERHKDFSRQISKMFNFFFIIHHPDFISEQYWLCNFQIFINENTIFNYIFIIYNKKIPSTCRYWLKAVFLGSEKSQYASPSFPHWIDQWSSMNNPDDCSVLSSRIHQRKWLYRHSVDRWLPACLCLYPCRCHFVVFVFFLVIHLCLSLSANDQWWFDRHWTDHQLPLIKWRKHRNKRQPWIISDLSI